LEFVETIQKVSGEGKAGDPKLRNVMREDKDPHESGTYTAELIKAAPEHKDDQIVVKQVISRKSAQGGSAAARKK
jgi:Asp-tRNA(Asn)/Glu-tRNA(Gln) amidotransferase C subunit